jgi:type IV pilus assembly protein PilP
MTMAASARNLLFGLTLIVLATAGCGNGSELEPPQQPAVLRKKIAIAKKQAPEAVKPKPPLQQAKAEPPLPEKKPMTQLSETRPEPIGEEVSKKLAYSYDPTGKLDPFRPIFAPEHEGVAPAKKKGKKKKRLPLTPLQRIGLSQLKLVGIIVSPTGNKALVEEPSGKGYVITKGTYIGKDFGRVKQILKDRLVVEEEVEDFSSGEMKPRTREIRLRKRPGQV